MRSNDRKACVVAAELDQRVADDAAMAGLVRLERDGAPAERERRGKAVPRERQ